MPSYINNLAPTTELEAVNTLLQAIGSSPLAALNSGQPDEASAIATLRKAARDVLSMGWQFNSEYGFKLAPSATKTFTPDDGSAAYTINIFKPDPQWIRASASRSDAQTGYYGLNVAVRPSRIYTESSAPVLVFYDRDKNLDGFRATDRPFLYLDLVWFFDFEMLPEEARAYVVILATRRFIQDKVNSSELAGFTRQDEAIALRTLRRMYGLRERLNLFQTPSMQAVQGGRRSNHIGFIDNRDGPRGTIS